MKKLIILSLILLSATTVYAAKVTFITLNEKTSAIISGGALNTLEVVRFQDGITTCYLINTKINNINANASISCVK